MKILLKLVFRFEKQIADEREILKILNTSSDSTDSTNASSKSSKRFSDIIEEKKDSQQINWNDKNIDASKIRRTQNLGENKWMSINQQVLNELLEFERQCMGFFDNNSGLKNSDCN